MGLTLTLSNSLLIGGIDFDFMTRFAFSSGENPRHDCITLEYVNKIDLCVSYINVCESLASYDISKTAQAEIAASERITIGPMSNSKNAGGKKGRFEMEI